jgi:GxxExxY protein
MSDLPQTSTDEHRYEHSGLTELVIGVFYEVYRELGQGFLEKIYEEAMLIALRAKGLEVRQQVQVPVWFRGIKIGAYEADLVVSRILLLELKACRALTHLTKLKY